LQVSMKKDTVSGSTEILRDILEWVEKCPSLEDWYKFKDFLITSYSSMAIILNFIDFVERSIKVQSFSEIVHAYRKLVKEEEDYIKRKSLEILRHYKKILTYSRSSQVLQVLNALRFHGSDFEIFISEARPSMEGVKTALELVSSGIKVHLFTDIVLLNKIPCVDVIMTGADAITGEYFVNKVGTKIILEEAKRRNKPAILIASRLKVLNKKMEKFFKLTSGKPEEILFPRKRIKVYNPYFEKIPLSLITPIWALRE